MTIDPELIQLELECRVLHAEAVLTKAEAATAERAVYAAERPDSDYAGMERMLRRNWGTLAIPVWVPERATVSVEAACYGWRRDYGEWPTMRSLAERLTTSYRNLRHLEATVAITETISDPSEAAHLFMIRSVRLAEIINDQPHTCGPAWVHNAESDMRCFVSAEGQKANGLDDRYRLASYRREAVA